MNPFLEAAKRRIYPNGVSITFKSITEGTYNPATGTTTNTETSTVITAFPKRVVATNYNFPNLIGKEVTEFLVVATDLATKPKTLDTITRGTDVYTVDNTKEHVARGEVVIYKILAVKG